MAALELPIEGMTCASCAARIERRLNKIDGVMATVNYATELAAVEYDPTRVNPGVVVNAVEEAGYRARVSDDDARAALRQRLVVAAVLSAPALVLGMVAPLHFVHWQWVGLMLATPVVVWAGRPFHVAAWKNLRRGAATMDTLISLGTLSAWGWSVAALFAGSGETYFEVAAVVITFQLAGRYFEARAKRNAGSALRALVELGAKEATVVGADGGERQVAVAELEVGDVFVVRPGEGRDRRRRPRGALGGRPVAPHGRKHSGRDRAR